jgi:hypothetical protein
MFMPCIAMRRLVLNEAALDPRARSCTVRGHESHGCDGPGMRQLLTAWLAMDKLNSVDAVRRVLRKNGAPGQADSAFSYGAVVAGGALTAQQCGG